MKSRTIKTKGVVVQYKNKFWGILYKDSYSISKGWGSLENAEISNPKYCETPIDVVYEGSPDEDELKKR